MRGVQKRRPSLFDLVEQMKTITAPTLVMTGDEDWPCLEPAILMKRTIPTAALVVMPNTGHTLNLEEPAAFNQHVADFLHAVDAGRWPAATRAPWSARSSASSGLASALRRVRRVAAEPCTAQDPHVVFLPAATDTA